MESYTVAVISDIQILQVLFRRIVETSQVWIGIEGSYDLPGFGPAEEPLEFERPLASLDGLRSYISTLWLEARPVHQRVLDEDLLTQLEKAIALAVSGGAPWFPDDLWARAFYSFALAYKRGIASDVGEERFSFSSLLAPIMVQILTYTLQAQSLTKTEADGLIEAKRRAFEREKGAFVAAWQGA